MNPSQWFLLLIRSEAPTSWSIPKAFAGKDLQLRKSAEPNPEAPIV